ncbi:nitrite/sulfite reductase [Rhodococcus sp. D2-41]|uniref:assimilatory sulfite reductase (ferredoxin) n=1 Tax=Speluncibacter jeojiensis TaxID=2710754 RepID=A0A9X4LVW3_9ACTN|nr:nitrite/sulfite reductase [Rhodococcus sp. D2-41]MDG3011836.1 nitrite/sulfite reductase [Rhodococcus sp. D2-41]MDG3013288.1 nitrite/sulfite reductase [Corynebacteriales bacterium D3-21]
MSPNTDTSAAVAERPKRSARPVQKKSEGQWALGYREPLNGVEQFKKDDHPLNVRQRIIDIYSKQGHDSIDANDLRGRFRWMGLYTQRTEGYDGTFTGDDNADLLESQYFMMRVRADGQRLDLARLRTLAGISKDFARDTLDITNRQNFQYHWVRIEDVPEIWRRLEEVGLQTTSACGDCPRGMLGSPLAGLAVDEVLDASSALDEIVRRYIGKPEYANLPRKYKTSVSGLQDLPHEINDIAFVGVNHPEHGPGLDLWVGGGLSTVPHFAQRLGVWVPLDEVPDVWEAVTCLFRDYGYRRLRSKNRFKFLVKDWGPEKVREVLETEYLHRKLIDGPAPEPLTRVRDHVGVQKLKNGLNAIGVAPVSGRIAGSQLEKFVDAVERAGATEVRTTPYQKLIVLNVTDDKVDQLVAELDKIGLPTNPTPWRRSIMTCTGLEFCKLAFVETRRRAIALLPELEERMADLNAQLDVPVTVHLNGCPNSCARIQTADIGFKGQLIEQEDGTKAEGFQVHLGGSLGADLGFGRKVRQHKVLSSELGDYIERVVRNFIKQRTEGERFAQWVARADDDDLR